MLTIFGVTWLGVIATQISPGPNLAAVAAVSLAQGRRTAMWIVAGISSGMLVWSLATALGLGALIEAFPQSLLILKFLGGGYLLFLAVKAARATLKHGGQTTFSLEKTSLTNHQAWMRGVLVLLTNPKAALMWAAVASFLFGQGLSAWHVIGFGPLGALSGMVIYGGYAILFSSGWAMRGYARFSRGVDGIFAGAFGLMGGSLIWDGLRQARD